MKHTVTGHAGALNFYAKSAVMLLALLLLAGSAASCRQSGDETADSDITETTDAVTEAVMKNGTVFGLDGHLSEVVAPVRDNMINYATTLFGTIYDTYLKDGDHKIVVSVIPDKNYYLSQTVSFEENGVPLADYAHLTSLVADGCASFAEYVDLFPHLQLNYYYYQDAHWKQEYLIAAAHVLADAFGLDYYGEYEGLEWPTPFVGSYSDEEAAADAQNDTLYYLMNDTLSAVTVTDYPEGTPVPGVLYNTEHPTDKHTYDMFLSGVMPLQVLESPNASTDRELILFRDSFGSSIAPLLCEVYAKITLVDLRYLSSSMLGDLITFDDQDVLFLYSTQILNTAMILK